MHSSAQVIGMTAELGIFFLILALVTSALQASYLLPTKTWKICTSAILPTAALVQCFCTLMAMFILITLRLDNDFTAQNVIAHSNKTLPTLYKIVGTWGNHEGSLLLWSCLLSILSAIFATQSHAEKETQKNATAIAAIVFFGFTLFMLTTSSPFARHFPPPVDGQALNPLLQDIALSFHPPMLYSGYVGFAIVFALAVSALLNGKMDRAWAVATHPWILFAWSCLTIGIGIGSWWAYRVLGWGGWWFWDPVENCSLLPWLSGTALLHANIVLKKRGCLAQWVCLLAIFSFGLSLLGTFLVRSGVLSSVHSFASDPARGMFILAYIVIVIGGALFLFALRGGKIASDETMQPMSREGMIVINNIFVLCACGTVLLGTLYPMAMQIFGSSSITVGAPYFNRTFVPLMAIPLIFAGLTPFLPWKEATAKNFKRGLMPASLAALVATALVIAFAKSEVMLAILGFSLAAALFASSLKWVWGMRAMSVALPVFLAHVGAATLVAGVTGASLWKEEKQAWLSPNEPLEISGYNIQYQQTQTVETPNYNSLLAKFRVTKNEQNVALLYPEYKTYAIRDSKISEPAIAAIAVNDLYLVIGDQKPDGSQIAVRAYYTPMIWLIWSGFLLMALGGFVAILRPLKKVRLI